MKVSHHWLQKFFDQPLPPAEKIAEMLTFHAFEIEEVTKVGDDSVLDIKVTANRGADCLSHRGIAKELSAILSIPLTHDPLKEVPNLSPVAEGLSLTLEDASLSPRYIAGVITGVKVGPSPEWLRRNLEALGQKSINTIVDATNFVMFNIGQPLHAFDAAKISEHNGKRLITVRRAMQGESLKALDGKAYTLKDSMLVITDGTANVPIGIAGVKGGEPAGITEATKDIIIESANFNGVAVRKTAAALRLRTDASARFEQGISPELAAYGMRAVVDLILKLAGGTLEGFADVYPSPQKLQPVSVSAKQVEAVLGVPMPEEKIMDAFARLGFQYEVKGGVFTVMPPFERHDLLIPEDLIEEVARLRGYDEIPSIDLPPFSKPAEVNKSFYWSEHIREFLTQRGFSEIYTSVFADKGERAVSNKVDSDRPFLRMDLVAGMEASLEKNKRNAEALAQPEVRLFEIGTVFGKQEESIHLAIGVAGGKKSPKAEEILSTMLHEFGPDHSDMLKNVRMSNRVVEIDFSTLVEAFPSHTSYENFPLSLATRYQSFSKYPFVLRDVALWVPAGTDAGAVVKILQEEGGELLVRTTVFDRFEKEGKLSLAFRLVFQSFEKTLEEAEVNEAMEKITAALHAQGFEIR